MLNHRPELFFEAGTIQLIDFLEFVKNDIKSLIFFNQFLRKFQNAVQSLFFVDRRDELKAPGWFS